MTKYQEEEDARHQVLTAARYQVLTAAMDLVDHWHKDPATRFTHSTELNLNASVHALRSLHADRGVRDPSPPGEQEAGPDLGQRQGDPEGQQP